MRPPVAGEAVSAAPVSTGIRPRSGFIVGPVYDSVFFIFSPLIAFVLGACVSFTPLADEKYLLYGRRESLASILGGILTMAHLVIVFFRSHLNPKIFRQYPNRFVLAPLALLGAMLLSSWVLVFVFVLAVWWDVYHSALQTFGLGRLYDARAGNDPRAGRGLDIGLNFLLYIGPIFAGVSLWDHVVYFNKFRDVGSAFFCAVPEAAREHAGDLRRAVLALGGAYLAYYAWEIWRLRRRGYRIGPQKAALFIGTGACSIWAWGFNPFGQAFFIMNFFHAVQYFALMWWVERDQIVSAFRLGGVSWGRRAALGLFLALAFAYGTWAKLFGEATHAGFSILLVVSIAHFWYDGFIWSVTRKQIV